MNASSHSGTLFILLDTDDDTADNGNDAAPLGIDFDWRDSIFTDTLAPT